MSTTLFSYFSRFLGEQVQSDNLVTIARVRSNRVFYRLTLLSYVNLWSARKLATVLPRPWESYLTKTEAVKITPSLVQRDFYRIISQLGTPAQSPKRRGYSPGRIKGEKKVPRTRHQVIRKTKKVVKQKLKAS